MPSFPQTATRGASRKRLALVLLAGAAMVFGMAATRAQSIEPAAETPQPPLALSGDQTGRFGSEGSDLDGRVNAAEGAVDGAGAANRDDGSPQGVRLGSFVLKPSLEQGVKSQKTTNGATSSRRAYLETSIRGTLTSDWTRHELNVTGEGHWQKNLHGKLPTDPGARLDADLRLDLPADTVAHVTGGYQTGREDNNDPNALDGATAQSDVQTLRGGASVQRELGRIRGLIGFDAERTVYSKVKLSNGTLVDLSDRDRNAYTLRGRIGYSLSPALTPYLQASLGKTVYDREADFEGYRRSSDSYALRGGVEVDLGEKLRGEFGLGYETVRYDDARLTSIGALTLDGSATWSPRRGTDVTARLETTVEDSTAPGESGGVVYRFSNVIAHELRDDLVARLSGATAWRRYPSGSQIADSNTYAIGAALAYRINRYLELGATVDYEWTRRKAGEDSSDLTAGVGLTLRR